jgi:hypothetical protein
MSNDERMSYRQYAKFEKVFFLYGSCAKMVAPVRPNEWKALAEDMWAWAIVKVESLVTACTDGFLDPPTQMAPEEVQPPPEAATTNGVVYISEPQAKRFYALAGLDHGIGHSALVRPQKNEQPTPIEVETRGRPRHPSPSS